MIKSSQDNFEDKPYGATPVGFLVELDEIEEKSISFLRSINSHSHHRFDLTSNIIICLGHLKGKEFIKCLEKIGNILFVHGRRKFEQHDVSCQCIGADEALFAEIVRTSNTGRKDDVITMSSLFVNSELIIPFVELIEEFGLELKELISRSPKTNYLFDKTYSKFH